MYYNSRDKINTLREEKLSLENENNDLEENVIIFWMVVVWKNVVINVVN